MKGADQYKAKKFEEVSLSDTAGPCTVCQQGPPVGLSVLLGGGGGKRLA